jgi:ribonuclease P/MRP protein subunit POP1
MPCFVVVLFFSDTAQIDAGDRTVQIHRKMAKLRAKGNLRGQSRTEQLRARQVNRRWLGSHIFHSKRFHMVNLWGYRLASTPTLKSFRSAYRAARRKATLHDASYFGTIGLEGSRAAIIKALSKVTSGGAFAGKK